MVQKFVAYNNKPKVKDKKTSALTNVHFKKKTVENITRRSSREWMQRHINDVYVHMAKLDGYSSRAAYKLIEIDSKFNILNTTRACIDLGCLPGSWIEVINKKININRLYGVDINKPLSDVLYNFFQKDINDESLVEDLKLAIEKNAHHINLITSDISSNLSGSDWLDKSNNLSIFESAFKIVEIFLQQDGCFIFKAIAGSFNEIIQNHNLGKKFKQVTYFKPKASRKDSSEMYIVCVGFRGK